MPQVGIDLVELSEVTEALQRFGDAYRRRVFTRSELAQRPPAPEDEGAYLAALLAAKEAVFKLLGPWAPSCSWHQVEVLVTAKSWAVNLSGPARMAAQARRVTGISVSVSTSGAQALAVAFGT